MHFSSFNGHYKDPLTGRIGGLSSTGLGKERAMYNKAYEEEEEIEDIDVLTDDDVRSKIRSIISPYDITSIGVEPQRKDMLSLTNPSLIGEESEHTTTARSTISPFSHRQLYPNGMGPAIGVGGADQAFRTTGNFQHIGSESGYADPGNIMYSDDEPLYDIRDIDDPMERSFKKHQKSVKLVLDKINECLRDN